MADKKQTLKFFYFLENHTVLLYILRWLTISVIVGSFIGVASAGFLQSLSWITDFREVNKWLIIFLPLGGLLIGLLYFYKGKEVELGNNLLIDTIHRPKDKIPFKMAPFVYIGTIVTHLFGGSAGREGTAIQMAGAIADQFSKPLRLSKDDRKVLIILAVSAGFGSVFGTPLAGAIFGLEFFLIGKIRYNAIFPAFTASIIADMVTKLLNTHHAHYQINFIPDISLMNIFYAIIAGLAFGICGTAFGKSMNVLGKFFKSKIKYSPLRPFIGGIVVASLVLVMGTTKYIGLGIPTILESFTTPLPFYDFAVKIVLTVITLSAGFKGGEVTPLFFIGATLGNALSYILPLPVGLLAGMGFVSVFAGATNTPLACSIMAMELFGSDCGIYVAISCVVAYLLSGYNGIYNHQVVGQPKHLKHKTNKGKQLKNL